MKYTQKSEDIDTSKFKVEILNQSNQSSIFYNETTKKLTRKPTAILPLKYTFRSQTFFVI